MTEEKESIFSNIALIRKFHPIAFLLIFIFMWGFSHVFNNGLPLTEKLVPSAILFSLYLIAVIFEFQRVNKEKETEEKNWKRRVLSD